MSAVCFEPLPWLEPALTELKRLGLIERHLKTALGDGHAGAGCAGDRQPPRPIKLYGVTATPNRSDKRGLRPIFSNGADQIRIGELIAADNLVRLRTFVTDVGIQSALAIIKRSRPYVRPLS
jgi:hypothetical protein